MPLNEASKNNAHPDSTETDNAAKRRPQPPFGGMAILPVLGTPKKRLLRVSGLANKEGKAKPNEVRDNRSASDGF